MRIKTYTVQLTIKNLDAGTRQLAFYGVYVWRERYYITYDGLILLCRITESEKEIALESRRWDFSREMYGERVKTSRFDG